MEHRLSQLRQKHQADDQSRRGKAEEPTRKLEQSLAEVRHLLLAERMAQQHCKGRCDREIKMIENSIILESSINKRITTESSKTNRTIIQQKVLKLQELASTNRVSPSKPDQLHRQSCEAIERAFELVEQASSERRQRGERLMGHTANAAAVIREQLLEEFTATRTLIGSLEQQQQLGASGQHAQLRQRWEDERKQMLIAQQTKLEAVRKVKQQLADEYQLQNNTRQRIATQVATEFHQLSTALVDECMAREATEEGSCCMVEGMGAELQSNLQDEKEQRQGSQETLLLTMEAMIEAAYANKPTQAA